MTVLAPIGAFTEADALHLLDFSRISILVTDARKPDNPIIFVNRSFERVTGYTPEEVLGKNCRFLQGEATDPEDVARLRDAIATGHETSVDILNYRKDGSSFINRLIVAPIFDEADKLRYFLGIQKPLTGEEAEHSSSALNAQIREVQHRVKNHLGLLGSLVRLERRASRDPESLAVVERRIGALEALYAELSDPGAGRSGEKISLPGFLRRLMHSLRQASVEGDVVFEIDGPPTSIPLAQASKIGLVVSEILTNTLKYAFSGRASGKAGVRIDEAPGSGIRLVCWDDGPGIPADADWPSQESIGGRIVIGLVQELEAELTIDRSGEGSRILLDLPDLRLD